MLVPILAKRFEKDLKLMKRRRMDMAIIREIMEIIEAEQPLPARCRPHPLHGKKWEGKWECHAENDWLLVYKVNPEARTVTFHRTGTHADLFKS
jgi:mRNA interferase YafQ